MCTAHVRPSFTVDAAPVSTLKCVSRRQCGRGPASVSSLTNSTFTCVLRSPASRVARPSRGPARSPTYFCAASHRLLPLWAEGSVLGLLSISLLPCAAAGLLARICGPPLPFGRPSPRGGPGRAAPLPPSPATGCGRRPACAWAVSCGLDGRLCPRGIPLTGEGASCTHPECAVTGPPGPPGAHLPPLPPSSPTRITFLANRWAGTDSLGYWVRVSFPFGPQGGLGQM